MKARNAESSAELASTPAFQQLKTDLLAILDSSARIPYVSKRGPYFYNFWRDAKNPKGLWRRTTLDEYRKLDPSWDVLIDLDALSGTENENWVWAGAQVRRPDYRRALVSLSRGGADASVVREFDLDTRRFVSGGFQLPEAKGSVSWIDADRVYVSTDFGPGSMTTSGYPRDCETLEARHAALRVGERLRGPAGRHARSRRSSTTPRASSGISCRARLPSTRASVPAEVRRRAPEDRRPGRCEPNVQREWLMVELRSAWSVGGRTFAAGSLVATRFDDFLRGKPRLHVLFEPTLQSSLAGVSWTRHHLMLNVLEDVKNDLFVVTPGEGVGRASQCPVRRCSRPSQSAASIRTSPTTTS